jgi:hypothetical protein
MAAWSSTMRMESKLRSSGEPQRSSYGAEAQRCGQFTGYQLSKSHGLVTIGYPLYAGHQIGRFQRVMSTNLLPSGSCALAEFKAYLSNPGISRLVHIG